MSRNVKRNYKDSVFIDLLGRDRYKLQLFQTLYPEQTDIVAADLKTVTLKQVITNYQHNDLAFLVKDQLMILVEAQSTWSDRR